MSGAVVAAVAMVTKAAAISGPFGSTMATRSPRPIPMPPSAAATRAASARKPPWVSAARPGAARAGAASGARDSRPVIVSAA